MNVTVTIDAQDLTGSLMGETQAQGSVSAANPDVTIVFQGAVVSAAAYNTEPAPGTLVSIFGKKLAHGQQGTAPGLPLPTELPDAEVLLGADLLPLLFTSDEQINAMIPYDLVPGSKYQLIVRSGERQSVAQTIKIATSQPAIFTRDASGKGQGHIYKVPRPGQQILADAANPAAAGDYLTLYCAGLGSVDPQVIAGTAVNLLTNTVNPVTLTINGQSATVKFAGLTPGFTGLYQVNAIVPAGLGADNQAVVVLTSLGVPSAPVTMAIR